MPGLFIVFEGLDGSGQSTQSGLLKEYCKNNNIECVLTKEPVYSGEIGKCIKSVLIKNEKIPNEALQLLFTADRFDHVENLIKPSLRNGRVVISDRYFFSTLAFGSSTGIDYYWLKEMNKYFPKPDVVFYINTPPEICMERIRKRDGGETELFEQTEKLTKVKEQYDIISLDKDYKDIFYTLDGEKSIGDIHKKIIDYMEDKFSHKL